MKFTTFLLPEGEYRYKIIKADDKVSQAGNDYIALTVKIWDNESREYTIFSNLSLIKVLKHLCDANNMQEDYKSGNIPAHKFVGLSGGLAVIAIEPEKPDGKGGIYDEKNIIKDYVRMGLNINGSEILTTTKVNDFTDSELPF